MRFQWVAIGLIGCCASAHAQTKPTPGGWKYTGSLRVRGESWDWFKPADATRQNKYTFVGAILRYGADGKVGKSPVKLELAAPALLGLPKNATAPAPAGALGLGAVYRAQNGSQNASVFLKQGYFVGRVSNGALKVGRFEFAEGKETVPSDPALAYAKNTQIAERLIGPFAWTHVGRSLDGVTWSKNRPSVNTTLTVALPTEGVFDLDGANTLTKVKVGYLSTTKTYRSGERRFFVIGYEDTRGLAKTDSSVAARKDKDAIRLTTIGGHALATFKTPLGKGDGLLWGAAQTGRWGKLRADSNSWTAQLGVRPKLGSKNSLALRGGYYYASGDSNPSDGQHGTFYPMLNTPRIFARTPFFAEANLEDLFFSATWKAGKKLSFRSDYHRLQLAKARDLWYQAGGPYNNAVFGLVGRPSNGNRKLADLLDLSADLTVNKDTTASFYLGQMLGKGAVKAIYPGSKGSLGYLEVTRKF
jgi:hypothetical protein